MKILFKRCSSDNTRGFTLIELMISVAIVSILCSVAIPNIVGYVKYSKSAEGIRLTNEIVDRELGYFMTPRLTSSGGAANPCYLTAGPFPNLTQIGGLAKKAWRANPSTLPEYAQFLNFSAMGFAASGPVLFTYEVFADPSYIDWEGVCSLLNTSPPNGVFPNQTYAYVAAYGMLDSDSIFEVVASWLNNDVYAVFMNFDPVQHVVDRTTASEVATTIIGTPPFSLKSFYMRSLGTSDESSPRASPLLVIEP